MTYKRILVAIDDSEQSRRGLQKAIEMVKENDGELILTHVFDYRLFGAVSIYDRTLLDRGEKALEEMMDEYVKAAEEEGISDIKVCIEYGSPKVLIPSKIAVDHKIDLIICGVTGRKSIERLFIESVSKAILTYAPCDVLVIR